MKISKLEFNIVVEVHNEIIETSGGDMGVLNPSSLEFALDHIEYNDSEDNFYHNLALLCRNIISQHPFVDGNKRTGLMIVEIILNDNRLKLKLTQKQKELFVLDVAQGKFDDLEYLSNFFINSISKK